MVIDIATEMASDHPSLASLGVHIASDVLQTALSASAGVAAGAAIAALIPTAPVVITFIAVVAVGFVVGMGLAYLDRRFRLTEQARARMMGYEEELKKELAVAKHKMIAAGHQAVQAGRQVDRDLEAGMHKASQYIKADAYKVDRYFSSIAQMMAADGLGFSFAP